MNKYRIVQVPMEGAEDQYQIEVLTLTPSPWWSRKPPVEEWCMLDTMGCAFSFYSDGPTPPPMRSFDTQIEAKKWLDTRLVYVNKKSKVVFEIEM